MCDVWWSLCAVRCVPLRFRYLLAIVCCSLCVGRCSRVAVCGLVIAVCRCALFVVGRRKRSSMFVV